MIKKISIKKGVKYIGEDIVNCNNIVYDKESLISAENELIKNFKESNTRIFTNLCSEQPDTNDMSRFLTTKLDIASTIGFVDNINKYDIDIELLDNNIFDNENLNPEDFRTVYRLLGEYNDEGKFVINRIVGIDIVPKEKVRQ